MTSIIPGRKNLGRYQEIAKVLAHHGFGWLLADSRMRHLLPLSQRLDGTREQAASENAPVRLRLAFEELGTAFIKVGQFLSTRPDPLPPAYVTELSKLQDAAPPIPYEHAAAVIEAELGAPPEKVFAEFDPKPLASAREGLRRIRPETSGLRLYRPGAYRHSARRRRGGGKGAAPGGEGSGGTGPGSIDGTGGDPRLPHSLRARLRRSRAGR